MSGPVTRRRFLHGAGAVAATGIAACSGPVTATGHAGGPSSAVQVSGWLDSRYTGARMGWTVTVPGRARPRAVVYCLHAKGADHRMAFDSICVPEVAARLGLPVAVAAVDGGHDSYWHRRADGSDALDMLLREFLPRQGRSTARPTSTATMCSRAFGGCDRWRWPSPAARRIRSTRRPGTW